MLCLQVSVNVSESIRRGKPSGSVVDLEISDLSMISCDEREIMSQCISTNTRTGKQYLDDIWLPEASIDGLREALAAEAERRKAQEWQACAYAQAAEDVFRLYTDDEIATMYDANNTNWYGVAVDMIGINGGPAHVLHELLLALSNDSPQWVATYEARKAAAIAERERAAKEREEREIASRHLRLQQQADWIREHGSDRLRRCEDEGIECDALYRDERLAVERPGWAWYEHVEGFTDEPRNPPAKAFAMLDDARKADPDAQLKWYCVHHDHDEDCYTDDCPKYDETRYVAQAEFIGKSIVYFGE